jgi:hypothetical protein
MTNDIFQRISIPVPCHEDWSKMIPDPKGAFCNVCNKSVHDFSRKSAEEVEEILSKEEEGKICGRFSSGQLKAPNDLEIPYHLIPRNMAPFRAFALAVFFVFGTSLFGITDVFGQDLQGKVYVHNVLLDTISQPLTPPTTKGEVKRVEIPLMLQGDTVLRKEVKTEDVPKTVPLALENADVMVTLGTVMYTPNSSTQIENNSGQLAPILNSPLPEEKRVVGLDPASEIYVSNPDTNLFFDLASVIDAEEGKTVVTESDGFSVGMMVVDPAPARVIDSLLSPALPVIETRETEKEIPVKNAPPNVINCFPNPSAGIMTIQYTVLERNSVRAELINLDGKRIKELFFIPDHYTGLYNTFIDLTELPSGIYFVRVSIGEQIFSTRVILAK